MVKPSNIEVLPDSTGSKVIQSQGVEYILELQKSTSADTFCFDPQKDGSNWLKLEKHRKTICKTQRQHTLSDRVTVESFLDTETPIETL